ncbi:MAG: hypothetical protein KDK05_25420 [Candidatus Competibacteraceae bacterium]|nr:hypothetical protein [Candidatus Competibacteraceae bacterium]
MTLIINNPDAAQFYVIDAGATVIEGVCSPGDTVASALPATVSATENEHLAALAAYSDQFPPLPDAGVWLEAGDKYSHAGGVLIVRQSHTRTEHDPATVPALFSVHREDADYLEWIAPEFVALGVIRIYGGQHYKCLQPHTTQPDWTPPATPALWAEYTPPVSGGEWVDSGETAIAFLGSQVIRVTDTAPFSADMQIRIGGVEAVVMQIHTPGVNGILVINPHIAVTGGEIIEIWQ